MSMPGPEQNRTRETHPDAFDSAVAAALSVMGGRIERESHRVSEWPEDEADLHRSGGHRSFAERDDAVSRLRAQKIVRAVFAAAQAPPQADAAPDEGVVMSGAQDPGRCPFVNQHFRDTVSRMREDGWRCGRAAGHAGGHYLYTADGEHVLDAMGPWITPPQASDS